MKTKVLKFGMPLMAFFVAIVFAFATNGTKEINSAPITGYIFSNGNCNVVSNDCNDFGTKTCTVGADIVYRSKAGTMCSNPLKRL